MLKSEIACMVVVCLIFGEIVKLFHREAVLFYISTTSNVQVIQIQMHFPAFVVTFFFFLILAILISVNDISLQF